jgi:hypothetical protein
VCRRKTRFISLSGCWRRCWSSQTSWSAFRVIMALPPRTALKRARNNETLTEGHRERNFVGHQLESGLKYSRTIDLAIILTGILCAAEICRENYAFAWSVFRRSQRWSMVHIVGLSGTVTQTLILNGMVQVAPNDRVRRRDTSMRLISPPTPRPNGPISCDRRVDLRRQRDGDGILSYSADGPAEHI